MEKNGSEGEQANKTRNFALALKKYLSDEIRISFFDERYSSKEAEQLLRGSKLKGKKKRAAKDRIAASVILESFLGL